MISHKYNYLPLQYQHLITGQDLTDTSGHSGATVLQIGTDYFLKIDQAGRLKDEAQLADWFYHQELGVEVLDYLSTDKDYLLTRAAVGLPAQAYLDRPKQTCQVLAETLRQLHHLPVHQTDLPIRLDTYLKTAQATADKGMFYAKALLPRFAIANQAEAQNLMTSQAHLLTADTLIHGDYCLPNIILTANLKQATLIDLGLAGYSDRHIDLFWALWSLHYNTGSDRYSDYFLDAYGREAVDSDKLRLIAAIEAFS